MSNETATPSQVLIVGTGLIGTSIGLALKSAGVQVWLDDRDAEALATAVARGAGERIADADLPDLIVVAVPPLAVAGVVADLLARYPDATVTDVCSVKAMPLARLRATVDDASRFVGSHPMAGRETSGPGAARADLFEDRLWAITASQDNPAERIADVQWLALTCGALVLALNPAAHDRAVALTSHTPQVLASVLAAQLATADPADVAVSGQGLRDATRLAASEPGLWSEILAGNAGEVAAIVRRIQSQLGDVADALDSAQARNAAGETQGVADLAPVRAVLELGNSGYRAVPDKHGGQAHEYELIPVVVADKPGELARLFAAAGHAGVNLEDVRIEHTVGRLRAIIELAVTPSAAPRLREELTTGGWQIRG
ncbi:MAG: prephenate dehydrogenase [Candidatus Nanopelagicales bacterium]